MKTDLSRSTFDAAKRLSSVRLQQGRMQLDADWNEEIDILAHHERLTLTDIIGPSGGPLDGAGFGLAQAAAALDPAEAAKPANQPVPALAPGDFLITAGHYYIAGLLAQNPAITTYLGQSDFPSAPALATAGIYLAYLDLWDRPLTSIEDPSIREVALGGPDTATRMRRIWQVRTVRVADPGTAVTCMDTFAAYSAATAAPDGQLAARAEPGAAASGPCVIPESAGYRSLENQLYRVEVHTSGTRTTARFKWSRENGSVLTAWLGQSGYEATVASPGPDRAHGFANGDWVELIDEGRELRSEPGTMVRLLDVRDDVLVFDPATADGPLTFASFPSQPRIRRWDGTGLFAAAGDAWVGLEQGVQVRFLTGAFRSGDYWLIPARTNTGTVEWPVDGAGVPVPQAPHGIDHAYARLGLITFDGAAITATEDCRTLFPPLSGLLQLDYVGGDGQAGTPDLTNPAAGAALAEPLRAAVSNGGRAVAGATVRFEIASGAGRLNGGAGPVDVLTGADGVASVVWRLGAPGPAERVTARLLDHGGNALHVPLTYAASHATASSIAFDPSNCAITATARTVQQAIDLLCAQGGSEEPGFRIEAIRWRTGDAYEHDGQIRPETLLRGLEIICDDRVDPDTVLGRPVVFIALQRPDGNGVLTVEMRIAADLAVQDNIIVWSPSPDFAGFLSNGFDGTLLCELTVRGQNIRALREAPGRSPRWLDAEGLERPDRVITPTGDGRRGGTLTSWFRITNERGGDIRLIDLSRLEAGGVTGRVVFAASGRGAPQAEVRILDAGGASLDRTVSANDGGFRFERGPNGAVTVQARLESAQATAQVGAPGGRPIFGPDDFAVDTVEAIAGLSPANRRTLRTNGLTAPAEIANLDAAALSARINVTQPHAETILRTVRAAARPR